MEADAASRASSSFFQRLKLNTSLRVRKLEKFRRQYSQRKRFAPSAIFHFVFPLGWKVSPVHLLRSMRSHFGHLAKRRWAKPSVSMTKRVLQSLHRAGIKNSQLRTLSLRSRGLDGLRNRLPQCGHSIAQCPSRSRPAIHAAENSRNAAVSFSRRPPVRRSSRPPISLTESRSRVVEVIQTSSA